MADPISDNLKKVLKRHLSILQSAISSKANKIVNNAIDDLKSTIDTTKNKTAIGTELEKFLLSNSMSINKQNNDAITRYIWDLYQDLRIINPSSNLFSVAPKINKKGGKRKSHKSRKTRKSRR